MKLFLGLLFLMLSSVGLTSPPSPIIWGPGNTAQNLATGGFILNGVTFANAPGGFANFDTGNLTSIIANQNIAMGKTARAMKVESFIAIAATGFTCGTNPTLTLFDCGTSVNTGCTVGTTSLATVTVTAAGTEVDGTVTTPNIAAAHYWAIQFTAGACTVLALTGSAEMGMQ